MKTLNHLCRRFLLQGLVAASLLLGSGIAQTAPQPPSVKPSMETGRVLAQAVYTYRTGAQNLAANDPDAFKGILSQAFGEKISDSVREEVLQKALDRTLPVPARVMFVPDSVLGDAEAAYFPDENGTILISSSIQNDYVSLSILIAEECGHHLDYCLGGDDSKGDEGEIFQRGIFHGKPIPNTLLHVLRAQNDHAQIEFEDQTIAVELGFFKKIGKGLKKAAKTTGRGLSSAAKATGRGMKSAAVGVGKFTVSVGQGIGREFSNFGQTVNGFTDAFSYAMAADHARANGDYEAAEKYTRLSNEANARFESYGSNLLISKVEQAIEGVVVDMATGIYNTFDNLGQSIGGFSDAIALSIQADFARANGDPTRADRLDRQAENARQRSEDAAKRSGRNVLDVVTAPGNGYNEITAAMNDTVPGLGLLFDIGLGLTPLAPYIIAAKGAADIRNAVENNPDNALAAGLTAGAFVAVEAGSYGAGKYFGKLGKADDLARDAKYWDDLAAAGGRGRSYGGPLGSRPVLPNRFQRGLARAEDFVQGQKTYENLYEVGAAVPGLITKPFIPGRDRDESGRLTGRGNSMFGISNSFSDSDKDYVQSPEEQLLDMAIEAHLKNFRKDLEEQFSEELNSFFYWQSGRTERLRREKEVEDKIATAVEEERKRIEAMISDFNLVQTTPQLPPPSAPPRGGFLFKDQTKDSISGAQLKVGGSLNNRFIKGPPTTPGGGGTGGGTP